MATRPTTQRETTEATRPTAPGEVTQPTTQKETALRGGAHKLVPPDWLNNEQRAIFNYVLDELTASGILGNLDRYALTGFAVAAERVFVIERLINESVLKNVQNKELIAARNSYAQDFWRGVNELSLSPQARAKIGALNFEN